MTHYQSAVDLTVGCIIVQRRHLSEASGSGRRNSSSQNGLIKPQEVSDSTREMENNRLIKNLRLAAENEAAAAVCVGSGCQGAARVSVETQSNVQETPAALNGTLAFCLKPSCKKTPQVERWKKHPTWAVVTNLLYRCTL